MSFLSVSKEEKLIALNAAKKDLLIHLYKRLTLLGHDPETYNLNDQQSFESLFNQIQALKSIS